MNLQRIKSGVVDPGYHFPKPTLFVNVSMPERKKTYLLNWLSDHLLWINQVDIHPPSKFPSPQMWRDFLNTIDTDPLPSTKTVGTTGNYVARNAGERYLGFHSVSLYSCAIQIPTASLSDPPLQFMRSLLWELYELNFHYELYALDWALAPNHWTASDSDKEWLTCQSLLYDIFPGTCGLVMWSESLPCHSHKLGLCATDVLTSLPYISKFCQLLSMWPGAPAHLQSPVELKG
ncbi:hypothetical protein EV401DRAFT_1875576 [Pisolithus croceorrhizus]|nr:hypothetical protein EV401DRAFT_1875576 [Pisolithus croceorrhizus]